MPLFRVLLTGKGKIANRGGKVVYLLIVICPTFVVLKEEKKEKMKEIKTVEEFNVLVRQDKPVLIDFYASWCGPCQALAPIMQKLSEKHGEKIDIVKIDIEKNQAIANKFSVRSIPTLMFIQNLAIKEKLLGYKSEAVLEAKIEQYTK